MAATLFRNALNALTIRDIDTFDTLSSDFAKRKSDLKKEHTSVHKSLSAIQKLQPDFVWNGETSQVLKDLHTQLKESHKKESKLKKDTQKQLEKEQKQLQAQSAKDAKARNKIVSEINKLSDNGPHIIDIPHDASLDDLKIILKTNKDKLSALAKTNTQKTSLIKKIQAIQSSYVFAEDVTVDSLKDIFSNLRDSEKTQKTEAKKCQNKKDQILKLDPSFDFSSIPNTLTELDNTLQDLKKTASLNKKESKIYQAILSKLNKLNPDFDSSSYKTSLQLQNAFDNEKLRIKNNKAQLKAKQAEQKKTAPKTPKNKFYQNYLTWVKTEYTEDHIKANGGPRKFASEHWSKLSDEQKKDSSAQWNIMALNKAAISAESEDECE